MRTVHVDVEKAYDVHIGSGLLSRCGAMLADLLVTRRVAVVTDSNVQPLYLDRVAQALTSCGFSVSCFVFPAGEQSKNIGTLSDILEFFARSCLTRTDCAIALGGGVVGDITGFAAGCYLRGIDFVQLPTTLLADVDSSVGGKTAIDLGAGKNLAGLFYQPKAVICDTDCLATLTPETLSDGFAEAVKTGILGDEALFEIFESGDISASLEEIVYRCVCYKAHIVHCDPKEKGLRRLLNLGHTPAHAIERLSDYTITHGHAVGAGTAVMARAAAALGICSDHCAQRIVNALRRCSLPTDAPFTASDMAETALLDKKRAADEITLIFPQKIGTCIQQKLPVDRLCEIFSLGACE